MTAMTKQQKKDIRLLGKFVEVYCAGQHLAAARVVMALSADLGGWRLCPECASFLEHAAAKRLNCPLEAEKPLCKKCHIHCYGGPQRAKAREIMAYAGRKLVMRGRLDYLLHYFL